MRSRSEGVSWYENGHLQRRAAYPVSVVDTTGAGDLFAAGFLAGEARGLGLEQRLRGQSFYPRSWNNRDWRTGEVKFDMIFGESAEQKFGAPYLLAHRGDLHGDGARVPRGAAGEVGNSTTPPGIIPHRINDRRSSTMGRYLLLWMLGIPLPILVLIYMFGGLH